VQSAPLWTPIKPPPRLGPVAFLSLRRIASVSWHRLGPWERRQFSDQSDQGLLSATKPVVGNCPSFGEEAS
jgi:hypothetical protein